MDPTPTDDCFHKFKHLSGDVELPTMLGYPFYYTPHPIAIQAAKQLQEIIEQKSTEWQHNFGFVKEENAIGKMFGVLVVQNEHKELGFLAGFSGKLAEKNDHPGFVPPVFDMLNTNSFYLQEEEEINELNRRIQALETDPVKRQLELEIQSFKIEYNSRITEAKKWINENKIRRKAIRNNNQLSQSSLDYSDLLLNLAQESKYEQIQLKKLSKEFREKSAELNGKYLLFTEQIKALKELRKTKSSLLQQRLFEHYTFLNKDLDKRSLLSIFSKKDNMTPPAGAGECSAPKLFQYAFEKGYQPLALAEFWWGKSPASEIRVHRQFYPACRGKCEPILTHMLEGIPVEPNPMLQPPDSSIQLTVLFEDDYIIAVNKPSELLSVPGKNIKDSVQERLKKISPSCEGPFLVHRLDMSTSGVLIAAKSMEIYKKLQRQFIKHHVDKRYIALLEGYIEHDSGYIHFPLRVDLEDRPRQLACFTHGKEATTRWRKLAVQNGLTRLEFEPITGRTHQLRVHSAHKLGLNCPIKGDDLYGNRAERLFLHAHELTFTHPITRKKLTVTAPIPF